MRWYRWPNRFRRSKSPSCRASQVALVWWSPFLCTSRGSAVVRAAHQLGIEVLPLTGPVSLLLALAASGLNGQNFAFTGYLPQDAIARTTQIQQISRAVQQSGQTRIVIETPYRNQVLLEALLSGLDGQLRLCVASGLTLPDPDGARSASVAEWRQARWPVTPKAPAVFLIGR